MKRHVALGLAFVAIAAQARDTLGVFDGWGAFRDASPARCYAIAEPAEGGNSGKWRPFASIAMWQSPKVRGQIHIRLSHERRADAKVQLTIDDRRWDLTGGKYDVWAPTSSHDAYIVAKIRAGRSMSITGVGVNGGGFADTYKLRGAASAIDAAALGCSGQG